MGVQFFWEFQFFNFQIIILIFFQFSNNNARSGGFSFELCAAKALKIHYDIECLM